MKLTYFAAAGLVVLVSAGVYLVVQNDTEGKLQEMQAKMQADFDRKFQQKEKDLKADADQLKDKLKEAAEMAKAEAAPKVNPVAATGADSSVEQGLKEVKNRIQKGNGNVEPPVPVPGTDVASANTVASAPPILEDPVSPDEARIKRDERQLLNPTNVDDQVALENARKANKGVITEEMDPSYKLNNVQQSILAQPRIARVSDVRAASTDGFVVLDEGQNKGLAKGDRFAIRRGTIIVARIMVGSTVEATQSVADVLSLTEGMNIKSGDEVIKYDKQ